MVSLASTSTHAIRYSSKISGDHRFDLVRNVGWLLSLSYTLRCHVNWCIASRLQDLQQFSNMCGSWLLALLSPQRTTHHFWTICGALRLDSGQKLLQIIVCYWCMLVIWKVLFPNESFVRLLYYLQQVCSWCWSQWWLHLQQVANWCGSQWSALLPPQRIIPFQQKVGA